MNKLNLAWVNARTAAQWHGGKPSQYIAGSMKLAYAGVNLRTRLYIGLTIASVIAFGAGLVIGQCIASLTVGA